jgi:hypothetical protein
MRLYIKSIEIILNFGAATSYVRWETGDNVRIGVPKILWTMIALTVVGGAASAGANTIDIG